MIGVAGSNPATTRLFRRALNHLLHPHGAAIDLELEVLHRRAGVVQREARAGGAALDDLVEEERLQIADGVDLRSGDVAPADAEQREPRGDLVHDVVRLLLHGLGARLSEADDALAIAGIALARLSAAGDD